MRSFFVFNACDLAEGDCRVTVQIASKRFLEVIEDLNKSSKTDPRVREMLYKAFAALAYDFQVSCPSDGACRCFEAHGGFLQRDGDLAAITATYNKIRPLDAPMKYVRPLLRSMPAADYERLAAAIPSTRTTRPSTRRRCLDVTGLPGPEQPGSRIRRRSGTSLPSLRSRGTTRSC